MKTPLIPVITVDGPSGSGKGTLSRLLARRLNFHFLDSGALYRILAWAAQDNKMDLTQPDVPALVDLAHGLDIIFKEDPVSHEAKIFLNNQEITYIIRTESCGEAASKVAVLLPVREALLKRQRAFLTPPGLIADGRDMGTVVFPEANVKIFLEASVEERALRRYKELQFKDVNVSLEAVLGIIKQRDERDKKRAISPLVPAHDAMIVDTTKMDIQQVFEFVLGILKTRHLLD